MDVTLDGHGEQQPEHTSPTPPERNKILVAAAACGLATGYFAKDFSAGVCVFGQILLFYTPRE